MQDLAQWLENLGMSEYAQRFAENKIDVSVLRHLTDQDLKDIGVALGHRRKILAAIAEFAAASATQPKFFEPEPKSQEIAERRQVTVVFSDLVGSTALSARMDPEDLREVISAYQKCVAATVQRFGGYVAKFMGDGVLIFFGYPQAHEDDAERAVRAGLASVAAVGVLKTHAALQTRVGIATGLVVVGDLIGSGEAQERGIVGETPNLAARMQSIAEPNAVVVADSTRKLLGSLFDLRDLGGQDLKGMGGPVRAWAALRPGSVESRFEAFHASGFTELVGREEELELLRRRWSKAKAGEGQVVLLSGEAGIGKSRLTAALMERLEGEPHTRLRYFCSAQHTDSALHPVIGQMERAAGLAHGDTAQVKLDKLDALLAQTSTSIQDVSLFADMLSLSNDVRGLLQLRLQRKAGRYPALDMTSEQRRQKTFDALGSRMEALSRSNPVLMTFEDAQWADPTSLEVVSRVVDRLRNLRLLLIATFRPEFDPPWIGRSYVTALTLNRLARRDIETVIDNVVGNKLIPASVRHDIIERTDGIPLFVEEMTKAVLEAGSENEVQQTAGTVLSTALAVPASLHAFLMARLDRLGAAREVAQIGAAIGREFSHALLGAVISKPEADLGSALERLMDADLLLRQGVPPHATYLFKHALVQDAAYGTLLREPRRALHARIAETLEGRFADIAETQPELLARHCTEAGQIEKAVSLWGKAGGRSLDRSALVEATKQLTRALDLIALLPSTPERRRREIKLQVALVVPLVNLKGPAAPETKAATERARLLIQQAEALGEPPEDPMLLFQVLSIVWNESFSAFNGDVMRELATKFLALAEKQGAALPRVIGHRLVGTSLAWTGEIAEGRGHLDQAVALYDPSEHRTLAAARLGAQVSVFVRSTTLWLLGYPNIALADAHQALGDERATDRAMSLMDALSWTSVLDILCGNHLRGSALVDELIALADQNDTFIFRAFGISLQGWLFAQTGRASDAVRALTSGIAARRSMGATAGMLFFTSYLAKAYAELGQFDEAWRCIGEALVAIEATKERLWEAEVNRIAGEIALMSSQPDMAKAEAYFERALEVARQQQAKSWELRAAMSMARLWRGQGKRDEARNLLAPVYGWFTEGFDTRDLKEAKWLLDELVA
jgi:class 3 adenylate cyclase/predicted ATPase